MSSSFCRTLLGLVLSSSGSSQSTFLISSGVFGCLLFICLGPWRSFAHLVLNRPFSYLLWYGFIFLIYPFDVAGHPMLDPHTCHCHLLGLYSLNWEYPAPYKIAALMAVLRELSFKFRWLSFATDKLLGAWSFQPPLECIRWCLCLFPYILVWLTQWEVVFLPPTIVNILSVHSASLRPSQTCSPGNLS